MRTWIEQDKVTANLRHPSEMLERITRTAVDYIRDPARRKKPFFLYVPFNSPHGPIVPSAAWKGKSGINAYADYVMETDNSVARILDALDKAGLAGETLVFFTTDNGCSPVAKFPAKFPVLLAAGHDPSGGLRGHKADAWEGGHRVPYVVRWPGVVKPGSVSPDPVCHNSLLATCAEILGANLPETAGPDSFSILPLLKGDESAAPTHPVMVEQGRRRKTVPTLRHAHRPGRTTQPDRRETGGGGPHEGAPRKIRAGRPHRPRQIRKKRREGGCLQIAESGKEKAAEREEAGEGDPGRLGGSGQPEIAEERRGVAQLAPKQARYHLRRPESGRRRSIRRLLKGA